MANTFGAIKRIRQTERRTAVNRLARTRLRHQIRSMRRALAAKPLGKVEEVMSQTFAVIDKAAGKGQIRRGTASRYKSRLHARVKAALGQAK